MENTRGSANLPYLRGSVPGGLAILLMGSSILAVFGIIEVLCGAVRAFGDGQISLGIVLILGCVGFIPTVMAGFGAVRMYRGDVRGADTVRYACSFRRGILITGFVLLIAYEVYLVLKGMNDCSGYSAYMGGRVTAYFAGYFAGILVPGVLIGAFLLLYARLIGDLRDLAECVRKEMGGSGAEGRIAGYVPAIRRWIAVLFITVTCLSLVFLLLANAFAWLDYDQRKTISLYISAMAPYGVSTFLAAAQFCLILAFYKGCRRSHARAGEEHPVLLPAGYIRVSPLCIAGTVLLSWQAFTDLRALILDLSSLTIYSGKSLSYYIESWGFGFLWTMDKLVMPLLQVAAWVLLAVALLHRRRALLTAVGAFLGLAANAFFAFIRIRALGASSPAASVIRSIAPALAALFFALLLVSAIAGLRSGRSAPKGLRFAALAAGLAAMLCKHTADLFRPVRTVEPIDVPELAVTLTVIGATFAFLCLAKYPAELEPEEEETKRVTDDPEPILE